MSAMLERLSELRDELTKFSNLSDEIRNEKKNAWIISAKSLVKEALDGSAAADGLIRQFDCINFNTQCCVIVSGGESCFIGVDENGTDDAFQKGICQCSELMDECIQKRKSLEDYYST